MGSLNAGPGSAKEVEIAQRRAKVLTLRVQGFALRQIAKACDCSHETVRLDLQASLSEIREESYESAEQLRTLMAMRLETIIQRLWTKALPNPTEQDKMPTPNVELLRELRSSMDAVGRLFGLAAPVKIDAKIQEQSAAMGHGLAMELLRFIPEKDRSEALAAVERVLGIHTGTGVPGVPSEGTHTADGVGVS